MLHCTLCVKCPGKKLTPYLSLLEYLSGRIDLVDEVDTKEMQDQAADDKIGESSGSKY